MASAVRAETKSCFLQRALAWGTGLLCALVSTAFFNGTFDYAQVKLTLLQMGAAVLCAWAAALCVQKKEKIFTKENWTLYLPFVCYYGWVLVAFLGAPYKTDAWEEFSRYILYFGLTAAVISQFRLGAARIVGKCIIAAAWVSFIYGLVQIADCWLPGVDFLPWRGFFGARVFSTHANPNFFADFIVFANFIVLGAWLHSRSKKLLALAGLGLVNLFFTESKGAWLGFAASAVFFAGVYINTLAAGLKKYARRINAAAAVFLVGAFVVTGIYAAKRFQSVSFRLHTWSASAQMAADSPVMGTGPGSFKTIYPAYRKPQIFYIENAHNTETQHAENELLEQWATTGTVGLALFLWMCFFVLAFGVKNLKRWGMPSEKAYWLLAYTAGFFGILAHNLVDVSLHFASTGLFFAVFGGMVVALGRRTEDENWPPCACASAEKNARTDWPARLLRAALAAEIVFFAVRWTGEFAQTARPIFGVAFGSFALRISAWGVFLATLCGVFYVYLRAAKQLRSRAALVILCASLWPCNYFFNGFLANHYYGIATALAGRNLQEGALDYYQKAIEADPRWAEFYQHRASLLRVRMVSPAQEKQKDFSAVYKQAEADLNRAMRLAPNHALLHQARGEFYYAAVIGYTRLSMQAAEKYEYEKYRALAAENMQKAKAAFEHALLIDPVNVQTYVHLISMALMERNAASARKWIDAYKKGPAGVSEPEYLQRHMHNPYILQFERNLQTLPARDFTTGKTAP